MVPGGDAQSGPKHIRVAAQMGRYPESDDNGETPPDLALGFRIQRWGHLPKAGGLDDQPPGLMDRVTTLLNVYEAHSAYRRALLNQVNMHKWEADNPQAARIMAAVRELEKLMEAQDDRNN